MSDDDLPSSPELAGIETLAAADLGGPTCGTYWGSHGCDRPPEHPLPHVCGLHDPDGVCSIHDGSKVRYVVGANADGREAELGEEIASLVLSEGMESPTMHDSDRQYCHLSSSAFTDGATPSWEFSGGRDDGEMGT